MAERIGIFGRSGSGKTSALYHAVKSHSRVVFFDPMGEAREWRGWKSAANMAELRALVRRSPAKFKIAFEPVSGREPAELDEVSGYAKELQASYKRHRIGLTLAVDELNVSFPLHGDAKCPGFADLCSRGRHSGITLIGVSQRVSEVSTRFRGNMSAVLILQQMGRADVTAAADLIGDDGRAVKALQKYDILAYVDGKTEKSKTLKIP